MGLNSIGKVQDTATIEIRNPETGKPIAGPADKPMSVTLYGPFSSTYKMTMRAQQRARMESGAGEMTLEDVEAEQTELLIACITDWNVALDGDEPLPCTPENIRAVLTEFPWVTLQLLNAHGSIARFLDKPKQP